MEKNNTNFTDQEDEIREKKEKNKTNKQKKETIIRLNEWEWRIEGGFFFNLRFCIYFCSCFGLSIFEAAFPHPMYICHCLRSRLRLSDLRARVQHAH